MDEYKRCGVHSSPYWLEGSREALWIRSACCFQLITVLVSGKDLCSTVIWLLAALRAQDVDSLKPDSVPPAPLPMAFALSLPQVCQIALAAREIPRPLETSPGVPCLGWTSKAQSASSLRKRKGSTTSLIGCDREPNMRGLVPRPILPHALKQLCSIILGARWKNAMLSAGSAPELKG